MIYLPKNITWKGGIFVTVRELLDIIDSTVKNEVDEAIKVRWINDVEGRVLCEICKRSPAEVKRVVSEDDELFVPEAYSMLYVLFVVSMIEFAGGEYGNYAKLSTEFEKAFELFGRWYIRNS